MSREPWTHCLLYAGDEIRLCLQGLPLALLLLLPLPARAALLFEEHFAYPNGNLGAAGIGDAIWSGGDSANSSLAVNTNAALTSAGLFGETGNGFVFSGGTFKKKAAPFTEQSGAGTNVYVSFLLNIQTAGSGAKLIAYLQNGSSASSSPPLGVFLNGTTLGLAKSASTPPVTTTLSAGTHLVVARYSFLAGNDAVDLWLDPAALGTNSPPAVTLTTGTASSSDAAALSYVFLNHAVNQTVWLDELRVGTTWAEVTPTDGSTVPPVSGSGPRFTQVLRTPVALILRGTNGAANGAFDLIASTSLATPVSQWGDVASDNFDASGNFDLTNPIPVGVGQQFYRLRIGGGVTTPVAPQITAQPTNLTVTANQTANFYSTASGTAPLNFQWYFNNAALGGATLAALTINNAQTNNAGNYFVIVTNLAGAATSSVATLTVSNILAPPSIVTQPQSQTVTEGATAVLNVTASGTPPLRYQWFFNTTTPLANQTNASLTLAGVSSNDAGAYSVTVTNNYGATNSSLATLTVNPLSTNAIDFSHVGFGNTGFTVTGGAAGPTVYAGSESELQSYSDVNPPYTIILTNSFTLSGMATHIRPNKTVIGSNDVVLTGGGLYLYRSTNVILRNLTIKNSTEDNIGIHYSDHVWIDHCTLVDSSDGNLDITQSSDYLTISWCKFYYTDNPPDPNHRLVSLIAASDSDDGSQYHITYHHNWWTTNCVERMPSVRFGRVHCFNNFYNSPGNNYCIRTRINAELLVENNFFQSVQNPWEQYITGASGVQGKLFANNNNVPFLGTSFGVTWTGTKTNGDGTIRVMVPGTDSVFAPSYSYTLDAPAGVPDVVTNNAGAGKGPFAP
ncbi:MAG: hypothetical protein EPO07_09345 [Verrucomicrobia bacterium]|nr:MAG: hypothetical protein EPO07_09345 [Verrucomicrobiota bacterium]